MSKKTNEQTNKQTNMELKNTHTKITTVAEAKKKKSLEYFNIKNRKPQTEEAGMKQTSICFFSFLQWSRQDTA